MKPLWVVTIQLPVRSMAEDADGPRNAASPATHAHASSRIRMALPPRACDRPRRYAERLADVNENRRPQPRDRSRHVCLQLEHWLEAGEVGGAGLRLVPGASQRGVDRRIDV